MAAKKFAHSLITLVAIFAVGGAMTADNISTHTANAVRDYTRPLSFEPNRGQADKQVDFLARGSGYSLFLMHGQVVLWLGSRANVSTVRMGVAGGNSRPPVEPLNEQPSKSNYFIGNVPEKWHTNIPNYAKVRYRNVYPGIDLIYYGNRRQLEYDFVVSPGADPGRITLQFEGAAKTDLDRSGDLVMHTEAGDLRWHKPLAYQEVNGNRKLVTCEYVRKQDGELRFVIGAHDPTKSLTIDPQLVYSTYLGGSGGTGIGDSGSAIAVDSSGDAYVTGVTASPDFPTKDAFQNTLGSPSSVAFLAKFDPKGQLIYSTYLGGSGLAVPNGYYEGDSAHGVAVDSGGNAYLTGLANSRDFPTKNAFQDHNNATCVGCGSAFVTKFDATGSGLVYSTYLGGSASDSGKSIAIDGNGNAYVTGQAGSTDFPTKHAFQAALKSIYPEAFVTKLDSTGHSLVYSTYLGGSNSDSGNGIAVDSQGHAYIAGITGSADFPTKNAFQAQFNPNSGSMAFVTEMDVRGDSLVYSTYLGGSIIDDGWGIAVDTHGSAYVTGYAGSPDFPTQNAFEPTLKNAAGSAFVTKFEPGGESLAYSTFLGGSGGPYSGTCANLETGYGIAVDSNSNAYVTGQTLSPDFPTKNAFEQKLEGCTDGFVTELSAAGSALVYSSYLGGSASKFGDSGASIAVDAIGSAYVTGITRSTNFPTTKNAFQTQLKSSEGNAFVTKVGAK